MANVGIVKKNSKIDYNQLFNTLSKKDQDDLIEICEQFSRGERYNCVMRYFNLFGIPKVVSNHQGVKDQISGWCEALGI